MIETIGTIDHDVILGWRKIAREDPDEVAMSTAGIAEIPRNSAINKMEVSVQIEIGSKEDSQVVAILLAGKDMTKIGIVMETRKTRVTWRKTRLPSEIANGVEEDFQRWKERMKAGAAQASSDAQKETTLEPPKEEPKHLESKPADGEMFSNLGPSFQADPGLDNFFGLWGKRKTTQDESVSENVGAESKKEVPPALKPTKSSRFAGFFSTQSETKDVEPPQPSAPRPSSTDADQEGFQRILQMLGGNKSRNATPQVEESNQPRAQHMQAATRIRKSSRSEETKQRRDRRLLYTLTILLLLISAGLMQMIREINLDEDPLPGQLDISTRCRILAFQAEITLQTTLLGSVLKVHHSHSWVFNGLLVSSKSIPPAGLINKSHNKGTPTR
ncbi:predicted protein [Uncinocarpus reesii 1704]|uniref:Uncharacterized protein n=1 Tax=Uncinocarpus reesii (strain UAMH 1704) TaxID=336963 RepID=C4JDL2_UNCRE|nr:uncharacterized protein UREG_00721 [Uncinocarpus reesii 1704]EEP75874.1 predicted protein [Uncinocarpus reesii 1704]